MPPPPQAGPSDDSFHFSADQEQAMRRAGPRGAGAAPAMGGGPQMVSDTDNDMV